MCIKSSSLRSRTQERTAWTACLVGLIAWGSSLTALADEPTPPEGILPLAADGHTLNLDFEDGTLRDWLPQGDAFNKQPVHGDTVAPRRADMRSDHQGQHWVGTFENFLDPPQGTLTSAPFKVTHPFATFMAAGGASEKTCVELVEQASGKVIFRAFGHESENLETVVAPLEEYLGQVIFIRVVDQHSGHWGHVNFDNFRFHSKRPSVARTARSPEETFQFAGLSPADAAASMSLPEGFSATLFAGEPDVVQPIAQALDDRGRLWVAEAYSYPRRVAEEQAQDRILIFEDTDRDGTFDSRKVFADRLNLVSGLELGFGGVYVGAAPYLLFIPDQNHDDAPDGPPQILLDGWGHEDTHETLNSFTWGPDGWLYGCHGVFTHSLIGPPGTPPDKRVPINAGIWRYQPVTRQFEVFAHGTSNPWGVDFDDHGQAFLTCCVIPHLFHLSQGGRYLRQAGEHFNPFTYADIDTIAKHRHWVGNQWQEADRAKSDQVGGGHAHAGAMFYLGGAWPAAYRGQLFMNNIHGARLNVDQITANGSGYSGDARPDFLHTNDYWSQIVNLQLGPDGQVYLIDWYDKNQCHRNERELHDRTNGRIFKVSYGNPPPLQAFNIADLPDEELVRLQLSDNDWQVRHARRVLQERGPNPKVHAALVKLLTDSKEETARLRALWALHVTAGLNEGVFNRALADKSPFVRGWAIQLGLESTGLVPFAGPEGPTHHGEAPNAPPLGLPVLLDKLQAMAESDDSPIVRRYLASAAIRLPVGAARAALVSALTQHAEDNADPNLPWLVWYAMEPIADQDPAAALGLAQASRLDPHLGFMVRKIASRGNDQALQTLVTALSQEPNVDAQRTVIRGLAAALAGKRQVKMPKAWVQAFPSLAANPDAEIRGLANKLAAVFGDARVLDLMRKQLADAQAPPAVRQEALEALLAADHLPEVTDVTALLAVPELQRVTLRALALYADAAVPEAIFKAYPGLDADARQDALATLASRGSFADQLVSVIDSGLIPAADVRAETIRQLRSLNDPALIERVNEVWGVVRDSPEDKAKLIADFKDLLGKPGEQEPNVHLGRALFAKTCRQCHKLFGDGNVIGPELTGSNRANLDYLLSNVIDPSSVMPKEYVPSTLETTTGRVLIGIVRKNDNGSLTVHTTTESVILSPEEVAQMEPAQKSMMPDDLLSKLNEHEVRSLVAYLASPAQVPQLATGDIKPEIFNGQDLARWQGDPSLWSVENGEIIGRSSGINHNAFLVSDYLLTDFRLTLEVKLTPNRENSGIQFRSQPVEGGEVRGYQADMGAGWWGKLYEELGRGLLWDRSGEQHVRPEDWNTYVIEARGDEIRTWLNGQPCVELTDPAGSHSGVIALQIHAGGPMEVRFRGLTLELLNTAEPAPTKAK